MSDYNFCDSWVLKELNITPNQQYRVLTDLDDLKGGEVVTFIGFDDVENHHGIFVFIDAEDRVLQVWGDFSGPTHSSFLALKSAIAKA